MGGEIEELCMIASEQSGYENGFWKTRKLGNGCCCGPRLRALECRDSHIAKH